MTDPQNYISLHNFAASMGEAFTVSSYVMRCWVCRPISRHGLQSFRRDKGIRLIRKA
jgi:hypothetical protein